MNSHTFSLEMPRICIKTHKVNANLSFYPRAVTGWRRRAWPYFSNFPHSVCPFLEHILLAERPIHGLSSITCNEDLDQVLISSNADKLETVLFLVYKECAVLSRLSSHCIKSRWISAFSKHKCFCCPKGFIWTKCTADRLWIDFEPLFFLFRSPLMKYGCICTL